MSRGIAQRCSNCGDPFIGSDCIKLPLLCIKCEKIKEEQSVTTVSVEYLRDLESIERAARMFLNGNAKIEELKSAVERMKPTPPMIMNFPSGKSNTKPDLDQYDKSKRTP